MRYARQVVLFASALPEAAPHRGIAAASAHNTARRHAATISRYRQRARVLMIASDPKCTTYCIAMRIPHIGYTGNQESQGFYVGLVVTFARQP